MKKSYAKRNADGLLKDVDHVFDEGGQINWRKMIKAEYLVPNKDRTQEADVTKLKDSQLIILLGGIKELAQIRGYTDVRYDVCSPSPDYVVATCSITWIPNVETEGREVTFSAIGDASPNNTNGFAKFFLGPIAENRAFVRCVRNFLRINIVGQEELGDNESMTTAAKKQGTQAIDPKSMLSDLMSEKNISFEQIKKKLVSEGFPNAKGLKSVSEIPKLKSFEIIERLKNYKATK